jgi:hypothetical protein
MPLLSDKRHPDEYFKRGNYDADRLKTYIRFPLGQA